MKKILTGLMGIMLLVGLVSGSAYALFSSTVTVSGVTFATGNADLLFSADNVNFASSVTFPTTFSNMYPGYNTYNTFYLKNNSTAPISLNITGRLTAATGDWSVLSPVIQAWIGKDDGATGSGYMTLAEWNSTERTMNVVIAPGATQTMRIYVNVPVTADNTIAGKSVSTTWNINGTQVAP